MNDEITQGTRVVVTAPIKIVSGVYADNYVSTGAFGTVVGWLRDDLYSVLYEVINCVICTSRDSFEVVAARDVQSTKLCDRIVCHHKGSCANDDAATWRKCPARSAHRGEKERDAELGALVRKAVSKLSDSPVSLLLTIERAIADQDAALSSPDSQSGEQRGEDVVYQVQGSDRTWQDTERPTYDYWTGVKRIVYLTQPSQVEKRGEDVNDLLNIMDDAGFTQSERNNDRLRNAVRFVLAKSAEGKKS